jgi:hypothetical protein
MTMENTAGVVDKFEFGSRLTSSFTTGKVSVLVVASLMLLFWGHIIAIGRTPSFFLKAKPPVENRFEIILSHYSEPAEQVRLGIERIKNVPEIAALKPRVIVYTKGMNATDGEEIETQL